MNDDWLEAYQLQEYHILDDLLLQFLIHHSTAAVLDYNDLAVKPLYIGKGLYKDLRFFHDLIH